MPVRLRCPAACVSARLCSAAQARAEELRPILAELAGQSSRAIAAWPTMRGIATPRGGRWQAHGRELLRHLGIATA